MLKRLAFAVVIVALPVTAFAQGAAPSGALCDGSEVSRAEHAHHVGRTLAYATAAADVAAVLTIPRTPEGAKSAGGHFAFIAGTLPVAFAGYMIALRATPGETFWENVVARMKVGETSAADVQLCLHRPDVSSSSITEQRWTYVTGRPSGLGGSLRTLRLTFRDSLLANIERTEINRYADASVIPRGFDLRPGRHHGYCVPPIPVVADPFPTPTDTTFAAAAMARAQADADAAAKNAQLQAAYAACLASDSAQ